MKPGVIEGFTHVLGEPAGWNEAEHGPCEKLHVLNEGRAWSSVWEPSPEERQALANGGNVLLTVFGGQPPVMLQTLTPWVQPAEPPACDACAGSGMPAGCCMACGGGAT